MLGVLAVMKTIVERRAVTFTLLFAVIVDEQSVRV